MTTTSTTNLPTLSGSEKQVAWATEIRANAIASAEGAAHTAEHRTILLPAFHEAAATKTDARWWIDNRRSAGLTGWVSALVGRRVFGELLARCREAAFGDSSSLLDT
jgi:hypothetical protein